MSGNVICRLVDVRCLYRASRSSSHDTDACRRTWESAFVFLLCCCRLMCEIDPCDKEAPSSDLILSSKPTPED